MQRLTHVFAGALCFGAAVMLGGITVSSASPPVKQTQTAGTPAFEGRRVWLKLNCYSCHGMHAGGEIAENIQGLGAAVPFAVNGGESGLGMPNFSSRLTQTDISNLTAYVNVAGTPDEPTFLQWWKADPKN